VSLPPLQAIVDVDVAVGAGWAPADLAQACFDGGARFLQIRAKTLPSGPFLELCDRIVALGETAGALVIVNDRVDLARLSGASGAHVGQEDLAVGDARAILGAAAIVGTSTHTIPQIQAAMAEPATYVAVGPVFGTRTKETGYQAVGLDLVAAAARLCGTRPVMGIGGITLATAPQVLAAGAVCIAVISDLLTGGAPAARVREYCRVLA
jgi:thiamine-phosphate pyrophosphorylase